ncbi:MAG: hypothetical protein M1269_10885 [Chloroflexi bacterium]|nr:hypothetical protein [Chloroflexota bacterium]
MNLELTGNPDIYKIKVYSRYKIQALTPEFGTGDGEDNRICGSFSMGRIVVK